MPETALDQSTYQVRLDWGRDGLARLAPADLVVLVDVLDASQPALVGAARGAGQAASRRPSVVLGGIRNAAAVAAYLLALQTSRGERTSVAVIPWGEDAGGRDAGGRDDGGRDAGGRDAGGIRFAVEDLLGAGAVIAALGDLGVDHCSPEAAVAGEGFRALRGATRHLLTASGTGRALDAAGRRDEVLAAAVLDASTDVPRFDGSGFSVE